MVLGIIAIVLAFIPLVGLLSFLLGGLALILGIVGLVKKRGKGQSITGIITGAAALIVAGVVTALTGAFISAVDEELQGMESELEELEDVEAQLEEAAQDDEEASVEELDEAAEQEDEEPTAGEGDWVEVTTLSGTGDQRGEVFTIENDARIVYEFIADTSLDDDLADLGDELGEEFGEFGDSLALGAIYLVPEGQTLADDGGIPEVMIDGDDAGETMLYQTGNFYLDVTAANYESWTVTIEERQ